MHPPRRALASSFTSRARSRTEMQLTQERVFTLCRPAKDPRTALQKTPFIRADLVAHASA